MQIITVKNQEEVRKAAPLPTSREVWYPSRHPVAGSPMEKAQGEGPHFPHAPDFMPAWELRWGWIHDWEGGLTDDRREPEHRTAHLVEVLSLLAIAAYLPPRCCL